MKRRYGIDTTILMRLMTGDPAKDFTKTVRALESLLEQKPGADILASNQVIGEANIAVRHHYGISKAEARAALLSVLTSGLVAPLNGPAVLDTIRHTEGCGLLDRLIVDDYSKHGVEILTNDRKMGVLPGAPGCDARSRDVPSRPRGWPRRPPSLVRRAIADRVVHIPILQPLPRPRRLAQERQARLDRRIEHETADRNLPAHCLPTVTRHHAPQHRFQRHAMQGIVWMGGWQGHLPATLAACRRGVEHIA